MKKIRNKISLATCSLLSQNAMAANEIDNAWKTDTSIMYYSEEERVDVTKIIGSVEGNLSDVDSVSIRAVLDSMAGPTPTGAVIASTPSFSGASGGGISPGASSAALAQFDDTRAGLSVDWTHAYGRLINLKYSGAISIENDYRSFSAGSTLERETSNRAYKFSAGIAFTLDEVFRVGGNDTPAPLSLVQDGIFFGEGEKDTVDVIFGVTRVINRRTVGQVNLTYSEVNGYLTDPYKVFSVVGDTGVEVNQYFEGRPEDRKRTILTANLNHQTYPNDNVINLAYRYYTDDWGIDSHTVSFAFNHELQGDQFIEPNIRLYTQTEADFYHKSILNDPSSGIPDSAILPEFVSADYRLDEMQDITVGATYGFTTSTDGKLRMRMAYFYQRFETAEFDTNKAIIAQISYSKKF